MPHVAASRSAPGTEPSLRRCKAAARSAGGSPTPSNRRGRARRTPASERASDSAEPQPRARARAPTCLVKRSAAGFVRFVLAYLSYLPGRIPSRRAHAAPHQVRGTGSGCRGPGRGRGLRMVKPELSGAVAGNPFPGHCRWAVVFKKSFRNALLTPHYEHSGATAFPRVS